MRADVKSRFLTPRVLFSLAKMPNLATLHKEVQKVSHSPLPRPVRNRERGMTVVGIEAPLCADLGLVHGLKLLRLLMTVMPACGQVRGKSEDQRLAKS